MQEKIYTAIPARIIFLRPNRSLNVPAISEKIAMPNANAFSVRLAIFGLTPKLRVIKGREDM